MNYEDFCEKVRSAAAEMFGDEAEVSLMEVTKNNGLVLKGLVVRNGDSRISPTIYLEQFHRMYESGTTFADIMCRINECANARSGINIDADRYTDFEAVRDHIVYKVINYDLNKEMLEGVPHLKWNDLAVIFCCLIDSDCDGWASVTVKNEHLSMWNVDADVIYEEACRNTPGLMEDVADTMENILRGIYDRYPFGMCEGGGADTDDTDGSDGTESEPMSFTSYASGIYVLTNRKRIFGATCMLYSKKMKEIADRYDCDLYILPSSIHEVILLPVRYSCDEDYIRNMIAEINRTQVDLEDRLSDSLYYYDRMNDEIRMASDRKEAENMVV